MMIENILDPKESERQGNQENTIRRIAALNDLKSAPQKDPPRVPKFPKQSTPVFEQIPKGGTSFCGHWMSVDVDPVNNFVPSLVTLVPPRTQHAYLVVVLVQ